MVSELEKKESVKEAFLNYSKSTWGSLKRTLLLVLIMVLFTTIFNLWAVVGISAIIPVFAAVVSHIIRKLLFPYIDLRVLIKEVKEENSIASAIIVFGVLMFMTVMTAVMGFAIIR